VSPIRARSPIRAGRHDDVTDYWHLQDVDHAGRYRQEKLGNDLLTERSYYPDKQSLKSIVTAGGGDRRRLRVVNRSALDCGRLWRCERSLASSGLTAVGTHKRIDEESLRV